LPFTFLKKRVSFGVCRSAATPAVAAAVELQRWTLERVVEMTADYMRRKEDVESEKALAEAGM